MGGARKGRISADLEGLQWGKGDLDPSPPQNQPSWKNSFAGSIKCSWAKAHWGAACESQGGLLP